MAETVLVTGGTGFIARWCIVELLQRGYRGAHDDAQPVQGSDGSRRRKNRHTTAKAQELLGWRPRPAADTVSDCARSLIENGAA